MRDLVSLATTFRPAPIIRTLALTLALQMVATVSATPSPAPPGGVAAVDGEWAPLMPPLGRAGAIVVRDPSRDRILLIGGNVDWVFNPQYHRTFIDAWAFSLATGSWTDLAPAGFGPVLKKRGAAAYDPLRDRVLVFGGETPEGLTNQLWELRLSPTPQWILLAPTGTPPSPRSYTSMIYDPIRDRMVLFGGFKGGSIPQYTNDIYFLELGGANPNWVYSGANNPYPDIRAGHSAVYDSRHDRMVVFGGFTGPPDNRTWTLELAGIPTWIPLPSLGPSSRQYHSAVYDTTGDRMFIYGGTTLAQDGEPPGDVCAQDPGSGGWGSVPTTPSPALRTGHGAVFDTPRSRMVMVGGDAGAYYDANQLDIWGYDVAAVAWHQINGPRPRPGSDLGIAWDPLRNDVVAFGGYDAVANISTHETWILDLDGPGWSQLPIGGAQPFVQDGASLTYDPVEDRMILHGVFSYPPGGPRQDTWEFRRDPTPTWSRLFPSGPDPPPRGFHAAVYDEPRERILVFGGGFAPTNSTTWMLTLRPTLTWQSIPTTPAPPGRSSPAGIYDPIRERMLIYGGSGRSDLWELVDLAGTPHWNQLFPTGVGPGPLQGAGGAYDPGRDRMLVFSGPTGVGKVWELALSVSPPHWTELAATGAPPGPVDPHDNDFIYLPNSDRGLFAHGSATSDSWTLSFHGPLAVEPGRLGVALGRPRPNPATTALTIPFKLRSGGAVTLRVFDARGRLVASVLNERREAGPGEARWDLRDRGGRRVGAGVYFAKLNTAEGGETRRFVVMD